MDETPEERERRLDELTEAIRLGHRLRKVEASELKRQSPRVQRLASRRSSLAADLEDYGMLGVWPDEDDEGAELPATAEAREKAAAAVRDYIAALGVEIQANWITEGTDSP